MCNFPWVATTVVFAFSKAQYQKSCISRSSSPVKKPSLSSRQFVDLFSSPTSSLSTAWKFQCSASCLQKEEDVSNLLQHLETNHPTEAKLALEQRQANLHNIFSKIIYSPNLVSKHGSLSYVIHYLLLFSFENIDGVQTQIRYERNSLQSL